MHKKWRTPPENAALTKLKPIKVCADSVKTHKHLMKLEKLNEP